MYCLSDSTRRMCYSLIAPDLCIASLIAPDLCIASLIAPYLCIASLLAPDSIKNIKVLVFLYEINAKIPEYVSSLHLLDGKGNNPKLNSIIMI